MENIDFSNRSDLDHLIKGSCLVDYFVTNLLGGGGWDQTENFWEKAPQNYNFPPGAF